MRSLFRYLIRNHAFVLFVLLEAFSLVLVFNYNSFQKASYLNSASRLTGNVYNMYHSITRYFNLTRVNQELAEENARLRSVMQEPLNNPITAYSVADSQQVGQSYRFIPAEVLNNSVNRLFNYITLNKGRKHGVKPDQGIMSVNGIVGVVAQVSESYSMGLSVLNQRWSVSAKLKKNGYYGSLAWQGENYRFARLYEIPLHADIERGDTVITSGYSSIFPGGILIGTIHDFSQPEGENYYSVTVQLSVDFKTLSYVEIVENQEKDEIEQLEESVRDDKK